VVPTLVFLVICVASSFAATFLCDTMARIPGNSRFERRIEFVNIFEVCFCMSVTCLLACCLCVCVCVSLAPTNTAMFYTPVNLRVCHLSKLSCKSFKIRSYLPESYASSTTDVLWYSITYRRHGYMRTALLMDSASTYAYG
jgi:hypothetical protein